MSSLRALAEQLRIRHGRLEDGELVLPGKRGFIAEWEAGRLAWCVMPYRLKRAAVKSAPGPFSHLLTAAAKDERLVLEVRAAGEGIFTFVEGDLEHVARRWAQCRFRREVSEEERARLAALSVEHSPLRRTSLGAGKRPALASSAAKQGEEPTQPHNARTGGAS